VEGINKVSDWTGTYCKKRRRRGEKIGNWKTLLVKKGGPNGRVEPDDRGTHPQPGWAQTELKDGTRIWLEEGELILHRSKGEATSSHQNDLQKNQMREKL